MRRGKYIKLLCLLILLTAAFSVIACQVNANEENDELIFFTYGDVSKEETKIHSSIISDISTIVLPSSVSAESVILFCNTEQTLTVAGAKGEDVFVSGNTLNLNYFCNEDDYTLTFMKKSQESEKVYQLRFLFSDKLPAIYLLSEDSVTKGREWVESSWDKSNKAKGSMLMQNSSGEVVYRGPLSQIKGRGNTTWGLPKRPYQIKTDEKIDLLQTGNQENASKTWVLLANYLDPLGVKNTLALRLGEALGMRSNVQGESVDLYYDGEYRGLYLLAEKVEVGSDRVEIENLEEKNEEANEDVELDTLPVSTASTENGATYTYCEGMTSPGDITGGYLLEMDYQERAVEEVCYFVTKREMYVVVKSPEFATKEEMNYIASFYQEYEDALFEGGVNPQTGKKYSDYVDARSVAVYYLINEFSKAADCFKSSAYLSKNAGEDKLYMGPLWDYDMSFGRGWNGNYRVEDDPFGVTAVDNAFCEALLNIDDFYQLTKSIYLNEFVPLIDDVLLGEHYAESDAGGLKSLSFYLDSISASAHCNIALWHEGINKEEESAKLEHFIKERKRILTEYFINYSNIIRLPEFEYYDVLIDKWYYSYINEATKKGILNGVGKRMFHPEEKVSRAQAVQAIYNMTDVAEFPFEPVYKDINEEHWASDAIQWAYANQFIPGFDDDTFRPENDITREQFLDILYRHCGKPDAETDLMNQFKDVYAVTLTDAVEWALGNGIIVGDSGYLFPTENMTRGEFAAILTRYHNYLNK